MKITVTFNSDGTTKTETTGVDQMIETAPKRRVRYERLGEVA